MSCTVIESMHIVGKRWAIPVIEEIAMKKFSGFNSFIGRTKRMTPRILSLQLKELEKAGLIKRRHPVGCATEYALTKKGRELHGLITEIKKWSIRWNKVPGSCLGASCAGCPENA